MSHCQIRFSVSHGDLVMHCVVDVDADLLVAPCPGLRYRAPVYSQRHHDDFCMAGPCARVLAIPEDSERHLKSRVRIKLEAGSGLG